MLSHRPPRPRSGWPLLGFFGSLLFTASALAEAPALLPPEGSSPGPAAPAARDGARAAAPPPPAWALPDVDEPLPGGPAAFPGVRPFAPVGLAGGEEGPSPLLEEFDLNVADVVFSAARKVQYRYDAPAAVHVITDKEIAALGVRSLADVLRLVPGMEVRSWMSGYHNAMVRGMIGSEVVSTRLLWLEEGVSINDVRDGGVWLDETFPLELIKRIEVILGPGSALYGTNAFQGVVNIYYKDAASVPPQGEYKLSYGSFARKALSATYGRQGEGVAVLVHASGGTTDGPGLIADYLAERVAQQQSYAQGLACAEPLATRDRVCQQQGAASAACLTAQAEVSSCEAVGAEEGEVSSQRQWVNLRLRTRLDPLTLSLGFKHVAANFDGALFFPNNLYTFGHQEVFGHALVDRNVLPQLNVKVIGSYHYFKNMFENYSDFQISEFAEGQPLADPVIRAAFPADMADKIDYDIDQYKLTLTTQAQYDMFPDAQWGANELIAGAGFRYEGIDSPEFMVGRREQSFNNWSVYLQDELRLLGDRLFVTLGGRVDTHNEYDPVVSYRGAVLVKPRPSLRLRASAGTAFKEPAMWQLYIDHIDAQGNPQLTPERLVNVEGGVSWQAFDPLELRLDGFSTWMKDIIDNQFDASLAIEELAAVGHPHFGMFHPSQRKATARLSGLEASARFRLAETWNAGLAYSYLLTDDGSGAELAYDSPHKATFFAIRRYPQGLASVKVHFVGRSLDYGSTPALEVPAYWLFQLRSQTELGAGLALGVSASFVVSEGLGTTTGHLAYDEMLSAPVPRYVLAVDLAYPF